MITERTIAFHADKNEKINTVVRRFLEECKNEGLTFSEMLIAADEINVKSSALLRSYLLKHPVPQDF